MGFDMFFFFNFVKMCAHLVSVYSSTLSYHTESRFRANPDFHLPFGCGYWDASNPEICFIIHMFPGPVQETVGEPYSNSGLLRLQPGVTQWT
jgi:hypothetical protein